jgi:hypothetical protein
VSANRQRGSADLLLSIHAGKIKVMQGEHDDIPRYDVLSPYPENIGTTERRQ